LKHVTGLLLKTAKREIDKEKFDKTYQAVLSGKAQIQSLIALTETKEVTRESVENTAESIINRFARKG